MTGNRTARRFDHLSPPVILVAGMLLIALLTVARGDAVFERVITVMFINLLLAVGLQMFMGNSGLGSFGQYAFVTIGAYASIWFSLTPRQKGLALREMPKEWWLFDQHTAFIPAILIAAGLATVVGAIVGVALVRLRGASFTIATFAFLIVVNRVALQWQEVTNGARTTIGIPKFTGLWTAFVWAAIVVVVAYLFKESSLGLKLRAAREDEDAASSLGVNPARVRWIAWVASVFVAAVGGALWAHFITTFSPHLFYLKETFLIVAMLIIGGSGSVSGAVVGAASVAIATEQLRQAENWVRTERATGGWIGEIIRFEPNGMTEIALAIAIILVLVLRPSGITGGKEITWSGVARWARGLPGLRRGTAVPNPRPDADGGRSS